MSRPPKTLSRRVFEVTVTMAPWVISMYVLYWLQYGDLWTTETAHRGKTSAAILAIGMALSFLVHSYFIKRERN